MVLEALRKNIKNSSYQAIMLTGDENPTAAKNLRYVTGYTGTYGVAIITEENQIFITDFRYRDQAKIECPNFTYVELEGELVKTVKQILVDNKISSLGFDKKMRFSEYETYKRLQIKHLSMHYH